MLIYPFLFGGSSLHFSSEFPSTERGGRLRGGRPDPARGAVHHSVCHLAHGFVWVEPAEELSPVPFFSTMVSKNRIRFFELVSGGFLERIPGKNGEGTLGFSGGFHSKGTRLGQRVGPSETRLRGRPYSQPSLFNGFRAIPAKATM